MVGSIPACAGEPWSTSRRLLTATVYPRVCGGTRSQVGADQLLTGLSPRVRGNLDDQAPFTTVEGSIPACAGEPRARRAAARRIAVYPRVCGGTCHRHSQRREGQGLSPRVRGNQGWLLQSYRTWGSIPACAGEPSRPAIRGYWSTVYPRVCGGTRLPCFPGRSTCGLSPRVRGNQLGNDLDEFVNGSIPACAGEPPEGTPQRTRTAVYPRVCGGTRELCMECPGYVGLSPRVRGNLQRSGRHLMAVGSIPACAGEPCMDARNAAL